MSQPRKIRMAPVIMTALFALASLKAAGLWIGFSAAGAQEAVAAPPPIAAPATGASVPARLLDQLGARKKELDARESELDTREKLLAAAEAKLDAELKALRNDQAALAGRREEHGLAEQQEFESLSNAYERMKARDAARIFEVLDDDVLIPVAAGMRTQALAGVLAEMPPERAESLTRALAGLSADHDLDAAGLR